MGLLPASPIGAYKGQFTVRQATRLLWRAGFGPRRGQARQLAKLGLEGAVASLTRPRGAPRLVGPQPHGTGGRPLDPINVSGDDHCWWLDRMVRSNQPLIERMTLLWHSWFPTSVTTSTASLMLRQNRTLRGQALGNFHDLLIQVTSDPAMLLWLSGLASTKDNPNENYAREMMELFTLGAGRGYSQADVHNQARALTGFTNSWNPQRGLYDFRWALDLHDDGMKTIFGKRGRFDYLDSCRLCVEHPLHPAFMISKLWSYFIADPIGDAELRDLERLYIRSRFAIRPLLEAILRHPAFYEGSGLVVPPVVYCAGMLRALDITVETEAWTWVGYTTGQRLFEPPNVAGWNYSNWLDTSRWTGRLGAIGYATYSMVLRSKAEFPDRQTAGEAVQSALAFWGDPELSAETLNQLLGFSRRVENGAHKTADPTLQRMWRQNALRAMIPISADWQTS